MQTHKDTPAGAILDYKAKVEKLAKLEAEIEQLRQSMRTDLERLRPLFPWNDWYPRRFLTRDGCDDILCQVSLENDSIEIEFAVLEDLTGLQWP